MLAALALTISIAIQGGPRIPFPFTLEAIQAEVKKGVDVRDPNGPGKVWFSEALAKAKPDIVQYFLDHGWSANGIVTMGWSPLYTLCYHNGESVPTTPRLVCLRMLLARGADPNFRSTIDGTTALSCLVRSLQDPFPLVRLLIKRGAKVEVLDNQGLTPFTAAVYSRGYQLDNKPYWANPEVMGTLLIEAGADPLAHIRRSWGWTTPLQIAASKGMVAMIGVILKKTRQPNVVDAVGQNALFMAAIQPNDHTWNTLLKAGANPSLKDNKGDTPEAFRERWLKLHPRK